MESDEARVGHLSAASVPQTGCFPFFFKQWGGVRKSRRGRILDGRTYDEMPIEQITAQLQVIEPRDMKLEISR
jgi:protein gp37